MASSSAVPDPEAVLHQLRLRQGIVYVADVPELLKLLFKGKSYDPKQTFSLLQEMRNRGQIKLKRDPERKRVRVTIPGYLELQAASAA